MGEPSILAPDLIYKTFEKVNIIRRRELEFEEDDNEYLKILPIKGVVRFGKKGKLSPPYMGPYEILQRFGKVAYELILPSELASVHSVFHVSMRSVSVIPSLFFLLRVFV